MSPSSYGVLLRCVNASVDTAGWGGKGSRVNGLTRGFEGEP